MPPEGRRRVSCVLTTRNEIGILRPMLPMLSDVLTESGHAWELIAVDVASVDDTERILRGWCELPGHRVIVLDAPVPHDRAVLTGVRAARGDAIVVLDARIEHPLHLIGEMLRHWEAGHQLICAVAEPASHRSVLRWPGWARPLADGDWVEMRLFEQPGDLVLMDRDVARDLLLQL